VGKKGETSSKVPSGPWEPVGEPFREKTGKKRKHLPQKRQTFPGKHFSWSRKLHEDLQSWGEGSQFLKKRFFSKNYFIQGGEICQKKKIAIRRKKKRPKNVYR